MGEHDTIKGGSRFYTKASAEFKSGLVHDTFVDKTARKRVLGERNVVDVKPAVRENTFGWKVVKKFKPAAGAIESREKILCKKPDDDATVNALGNDVILRQIFKHAGTKDLLAFRFVDKKWNQAATNVLKTEACCISNYKLIERTMPIFGTIPNSTHIVSNFNNLMNCIVESQNFPFVGLNFAGWIWKVSSPHVKKFLRLFGSKIRRLCIDSNFQSGGPLIDLLGKFLPNLEQLEVTEVGNLSRINLMKDGELLVRNSKRLCLSSLKILVIHHRMDRIFGTGKRKFCEEVIQAAPKLRRIENFHCSMTDAVIACGKIHLIASMMFTPKANDIPGYLKLSKQNLKLRSMTIDKIEDITTLNDNEICQLRESMLGILASSSEALENLEMNPMGLLKEHRIPVMKKLKSLQVVHNVLKMRNVDGASILNSFRMFPDGIQVSRAFPCLHKVRLELQIGTFNFMYRYFGNPSNGETVATFPTVKILELACQFDGRGVQEMAKFFPNATHWRIDWSKCFQSPHACPSVWNLPSNIQKLEIHELRFPWDQGPNNRGVALDSFFTGIPEDICANLRCAPKQHIDPILLRCLPSLVDLKELQELKISFSYSGMLAMFLQTRQPLISEVTGWYALECMPQLKTTFIYDFHHGLRGDMEKILKPMTKFVKFVHQESSTPF